MLAHPRLLRLGLMLSVLALVSAGCHHKHYTSAPLLQSITVSPANPNLKTNRTLQLTAIGHFSDGTSHDFTNTVTWSSAPANVVTTSTGGLATPVPAATGATTVTATTTDIQGGTIQGSTVLTLKPVTFAVGDTNTVNDPLAGQQWHLLNIGQSPCAYSNNPCTSGFDLNVNPVYSTSGLSGFGTIVAVVDSGLEIRHEDLAANVIPNGSWNFITHSTDPTNSATDGDHGTSVAGIIAAVADNGVGGIGVAPEAGLKGFNFISSNQLEADYIASLGGSTASPNSSDVMIFNQSYGTSDTVPFVETTAVVTNFINGVTLLRSGKGALYVKAAGNGFGDINGATTTCTGAAGLGISCENANFDPDNVLPYNIVVGALNASGVKSSYSTTGSALWVSAPGGEYGTTNPPFRGYSSTSVYYQPAIVTTDQSGCAAGYSQAQATNPYYPGVSNFDLGSVPDTNCNYTSTFNGTSSATPMVSGVIALMLQANPNLTWRDVRHILASTSLTDVTQAAITINLTNNAIGCTPGSGNCYEAEQGWVVNKATSKAGGGYLFHNWYGFGRVDASAAVTMATTTCSGGCGLGSFAVYPGTNSWLSSAPNAFIPNNSAAGATDSISMPSGSPSFVEAVQIQVTIQHSYWGDLGIELTSPQGTKSILKNIRDGLNYNTSAAAGSMVLLTNAFYGETGIGTWTLRVVDGQSGTNSTGGTLLDWQIRVFGH